MRLFEPDAGFIDIGSSAELCMVSSCHIGRSRHRYRACIPSGTVDYLYYWGYPQVHKSSVHHNRLADSRCSHHTLPLADRKHRDIGIRISECTPSDKAIGASPCPPFSGRTTSSPDSGHNRYSLRARLITIRRLLQPSNHRNQIYYLDSPAITAG